MRPLMTAYSEAPRHWSDTSAKEYIQKRLLEEKSPTEHGWLRSRWSCKLLAVELFKERAVALVSRETLPRVLHRMGFRWRRPRPIPPEKDSARTKGAKAQQARRCAANA